MPLGEPLSNAPREPGGIPGVSRDTDMFRSHTPVDTSSTSFVNQAKHRRHLQPATKPTHFTSPQEPGGNQTPRIEGEALQPVQNQFSEQKLIAIRQQEKQEQAIEDHAMWLGGLFEAGGSMGIYIQTQMARNIRGEQYTNAYARPIVSFGDNDEERVRKLQELFGGGVKKDSRHNSWDWRLTGNQAITLANAVQPFTPSYQEFMAASQMWDDMLIEERITAAQELKVNISNRRRKIEVDSTAYIQLVQQPQFLAGVLDSRGFIYMRPYKDQAPSPNIDVLTQNLPLLTALRKAYGGSISTSHIYSTTRWETVANQARNLYDLVKPHLLLRAEMAEQVFSQPPSRRGKEGK